MELAVPGNSGNPRVWPYCCRLSIIGVRAVGRDRRISGTSVSEVIGAARCSARVHIRHCATASCPESIRINESAKSDQARSIILIAAREVAIAEIQTHCQP